MTLKELLDGREPLRCGCGEELLAEEVEVEGETFCRFLPCDCGTETSITVPPGSLIGGFGRSPVLTVWGPPRAPEVYDRR